MRIGEWNLTLNLDLLVWLLQIMISCPYMLVNNNWLLCNNCRIVNRLILLLHLLNWNWSNSCHKLRLLNLLRLKMLLRVENYLLILSWQKIGNSLILENFFSGVLIGKILLISKWKLRVLMTHRRLLNQRNVIFDLYSILIIVQDITS